MIFWNTAKLNLMATYRVELREYSQWFVIDTRDSFVEACRSASNYTRIHSEDSLRIVGPQNQINEI